MAQGDHGETGPAPGEDLGTAATAPLPSSLSEPLGARPGGDKLMRAMARSRIADALFARTEPVKIGRYQLLEVVGAGGMGVVWGAWDPELDRRVAIKLLNATMQAARDRIVREGQALARLSHPNVVPVYDVGVVDDQVYLVMEWVRGQNLRSYCKQPRSVGELVAVYRAAGEGLAAAHRAGLIHRDFKPENAMLGDDGRVRVLDFGLARGEPRAAGDGGEARVPEDGEPGAAADGAESPSEPTRGVGTPRYMAPEQADGTAITPAVDQYALCVSLREALIARRGDGAPAELASWLVKILDRGTARAAGDRYPSIDELLRALARDPATVWRRRLVVAGAAAAVVAAFAVGAQRAGAPEVDRCAGGAQELAASWNPAVRSRLAAHLSSLGAYGTAEAARLGASLDRYGERWIAAHHGACLARAHDEIAAEHYQRNLACLARTRVALDTILDVLSRVDRERLADAAGAAGALPDAGQCLADTRDPEIEAPPAERAAQVAEVDHDIQRTEVLARAIAPQAIERAEATVQAAERLGHPPLIARALWVHGLALVQRGRHGEAAAVLARAADRAFAARDQRTGILAFAQEIHEAKRELDPAKRPTDPATLAGAIPIVMAIASGLGPSGSHERAFLYNSIGTVHLMSQDRAAAQHAFEDAAREQARSADQVDLAWIWANLAIVTDDPGERDRLFGRASIELERSYGPDHPVALRARLQAADATDNPVRAVDGMRAACRRFAEVHPELLDHIAEYWFEIGQILEERGDVAAEREAFAQLPTEADEAKIAQAYLAVLDGKPADAVAPMQQLIGELLRTDHVWSKLRASDALYIAARGELAIGRSVAAIADLRRALELLGAGGKERRSGHVQRRLARIRTALAHALAEAHPAEAWAYARDALAWSRAAGGYEARVAELAAMDSR